MVFDIEFFAKPFPRPKRILEKAISYWKKTMFFKHVGKEFGQLKKITSISTCQIIL